MKRLLLLSLLPLWLLGALPLSAQDGADDPVVLRFADEEVTRSVYDDWLVLHRGEEMVEAYGAWRVALDAARRADLAPSPASVVATVEAIFQARIDGAFGGDRDGWLEELEGAGRTLEGALAEREIDVARDLALAALLRSERTIDEADLRAAWRERYGLEGKSLEVRLLYLNLQVNAEPGETRAQSRERREAQKLVLAAQARELRQRALAGEDFAALARAHSDDVESASNGGRPRGRLDLRAWPEEARAALARIAPGELSEPLFARGGYWLVLMEGIEVTSFESVAELLRLDLAEAEPSGSEIGRRLAALLAEQPLEVAPALFSTGSAQDVVLRVGAQAVTRAEFGAWLRRYRGELSAARFVQQRMVERLARERSLSVGEDEIERRLEADILRDVDTFHHGDRERWLASLISGGQSEDAYRRRLRLRTRTDLLTEAIVKGERAIDEAEIAAAWEARHGPGGRRYELRWIRLDLPPAPPEAIESGQTHERWRADALVELEAEGEALHRRIADGEDFATLAKRHSDDPFTRDRGGAPQPDFRIAMLPPELADAVRPLRPGQLTAPIPWADSVFLIELVRVVDVPLESVREALREALRERRPTAVEIASRKLALTRDVALEVSPAMLR